jgi:hypothetical protein
MKMFTSELAYFLRGQARQNVKILVIYSSFLLLMILGYAAIFRFLMWHLEGREYSFIAGMNVLESKETIFLTEGINVFRRPLPPTLSGQSIAASRLRPLTGCSIVALERPGEPEPLVSPPPETVLEEGLGLILIGSPEQEERFNLAFP